MATFRKRGSKWHVQVRRSGHPAITRSFTHKADAEAWVRKTERQIDNGDVVANHHTLKSHTIGSLPKRYEATITPKKRGDETEIYRLRTLKAHKISSCSLASLSPGKVSQFCDDRLKQVAPGIVRLCLVLKKRGGRRGQIVGCGNNQFFYCERTKFFKKQRLAI